MLSVLMPAYNAEKYIGAAYGKDQFTYSSARSVAEQVYVHPEYSAVELLPEETD